MWPEANANAVILARQLRSLNRDPVLLARSTCNWTLWPCPCAEERPCTASEWYKCGIDSNSRHAYCVHVVPSVVTRGRAIEVVRTEDIRKTQNHLFQAAAPPASALVGGLACSLPLNSVL